LFMIIFLLFSCNFISLCLFHNDGLRCYFNRVNSDIFRFMIFLMSTFCCLFLHFLWCILLFSNKSWYIFDFFIFSLLVSMDRLGYLCWLKRLIMVFKYLFFLFLRLGLFWFRTHFIYICISPINLSFPFICWYI